jgi:hypothetical protein
MNPPPGLINRGTRGSVTKTAYIELRSGRVSAPAGNHGNTGATVPRTIAADHAVRETGMRVVRGVETGTTSTLVISRAW